MLERLFHIRQAGSTVKTEIVAGFTTFVTMSYIIFVNPTILMQAGMDKGAVMTATCLAAAIATFVMAFFANYPFALAPGMGLNAYFAFTVVRGMDISWQTALGAVLISGFVFLVLNFFQIRQMIITAIPDSLKHAIAAGIGLFIAFIGLQQSGIITSSSTTSVALGNLQSVPVILATVGIIITSVMIVKQVRGAILWGILLVTLLGIILGQVPLPGALISAPPSLAPTLLQFDLPGALNLGFFTIIFVFLFIDIFDTVGTLVGVGRQGGYIRPDGTLPRAGRALFADAFGTVAGALLGTSTVTTYIESASGITEGGRTGLTSLTVGVLFCLALFFFPLINIVQPFATAPALIIVGSIMAKSIMHIDWNDPTVSIACFLTIIAMPLTYNIANGIAFGIILYTLINLFTGNHKKINGLLYILTVIFLIRYFITTY